MYTMDRQILVSLTTWFFRFTSSYAHDLLINDTAIFSSFLIKVNCNFEQGSNIEITKNILNSSLDPHFTKYKTLCSTTLLTFYSNVDNLLSFLHKDTCPVGNLVNIILLKL